jgi:hypothetical protein
VLRRRLVFWGRVVAGVLFPAHGERAALRVLPGDEGGADEHEVQRLARGVFALDGLGARAADGFCQHQDIDAGLLREFFDGVFNRVRGHVEREFRRLVGGGQTRGENEQ